MIERFTLNMVWDYGIMGLREMIERSVALW